MLGGLRMELLVLELLVLELIRLLVLVLLLDHVIAGTLVSGRGRHVLFVGKFCGWLDLAFIETNVREFTHVQNSRCPQVVREIFFGNNSYCVAI